jgi:hypothetical protein
MSPGLFKADMPPNENQTTDHRRQVKQLREPLPLEAEASRSQGMGKN